VIRSSIFLTLAERSLMAENHKAPEKVHGMAHIFAAASYSWFGAKRLWGETAFRHELLAGGLVLILFSLIDAATAYFMFAILLILLTLALEALNTAIEEIVNLVSPEWSLTAKHAKDLGSFAVFCMLCSNGVFAIFVVLTTFDWI
jgi:diacylglycerol kinase (ATP)